MWWSEEKATGRAGVAARMQAARAGLVPQPRSALKPVIEPPAGFSVCVLLALSRIFAYLVFLPLFALFFRYPLQMSLPMIFCLLFSVAFWRRILLKNHTVLPFCPLPQ